MWLQHLRRFHKGSSKTGITADLPCLSHMKKTWFSQSMKGNNDKNNPVKTVASASRVYSKIHVWNCVGGRQPNTSTIFMQPLQHYAITICIADTNRPEKKD